MATEILTKTKIDKAFREAGDAALKLSDGGGLNIVKPAGSTSAFFTLRYSVRGTGFRSEMGLGSLDDVTLDKAREAAKEFRAMAREGKNPRVERMKSDAMSAEDLTLENSFYKYLETRKHGLRDGGKAARYDAPLRVHVFPKIGSLLVKDIDQNMIVEALRDCWHKRPASAIKALSRIRLTLKWAVAKGVQIDPGICDQAKTLLGEQGHEEKHHASMPYDAVPGFYASLQPDQYVSHRALAFTVLSVLRSGSVRHARYEWIDRDAQTMTVPREYMKGTRKNAKPFTLPLTRQMLDLIGEGDTGLIFPSARGTTLSDMSLSSILRKRPLPYTVHGFRSTAKGYLIGVCGVDYFVGETILQHAVGGKVAQAYDAQTDNIERRREFMQQWSDYVAP